MTHYEPYSSLYSGYLVSLQRCKAAMNLATVAGYGRFTAVSPCWSGTKGNVAHWSNTLEPLWGKGPRDVSVFITKHISRGMKSGIFRHALTAEKPNACSFLDSEPKNLSCLYIELTVTLASFGQFTHPFLHAFLGLAIHSIRSQFPVQIPQGKWLKVISTKLLNAEKGQRIRNFPMPSIPYPPKQPGSLKIAPLTFLHREFQANVPKVRSDGTPRSGFTMHTILI